MDKQNLLYPYTRILLRNRKEKQENIRKKNDETYYKTDEL